MPHPHPTSHCLLFSRKNMKLFKRRMCFLVSLGYTAFMLMKSHGRTAVFCLIIALALLAGLIGLPHVGMDMESDAQMSFCPVMLGSAICSMSPIQHIALWQNMLTSIPQNTALLVFLILSALSLGLAWLWTRLWNFSFEERAQSCVPHVSTDALPTPFLQELFSSGILNPKLF